MSDRRLAAGGRRYRSVAPGEGNTCSGSSTAVSRALHVSFLISALLDQASARDSEARAEATASIQLARDSFALPDAKGDQLRRSLLSYEQSAIAEWPLASQGQSLPQAEKALANLHQTFLDVGRRITGQALFPLPEIEPNLDSLSQARSLRILEGAINSGLTESLWTILLLTSALVAAWPKAVTATSQHQNRP
jgi:hypothetical protein